MREYVLFAAFCLLSTAAYAAPIWISMGSSTDGSTWFADAASAHDINEGYPAQRVRRVWVKVDFSKVPSQPAREAKVLYYFKCAEEQYKSVTWISYKADGSVLRDESPSFPVYKPAVPESVIDSVLEAVCAANLAAPSRN